MEARDAAGDKDTQIVRIEQLYPFPTERAGRRASSAMTEARRGGLVPGRAAATTAPGSSSSRSSSSALDDAGGKAPMRAALCRPQGRRHRPPPASPSATLPSRARSIADALGHSVRQKPQTTASASQGRGRPWPPKSKSRRWVNPITEATVGQWLKKPGDAVAARRAHCQPGDRQGRGRSALAGRRRDGRAARQGRRHGRRSARSSRSVEAGGAPAKAAPPPLPSTGRFAAAPRAGTGRSTRACSLPGRGGRRG